MELFLEFPEIREKISSISSLNPLARPLPALNLSKYNYPRKQLCRIRG